jgi:DtxR family manganese transport transcriptional regulator
MTKKQTDIIDAATQATWFSHVREAHHMETAEDYVELIADLIAAKGEARLVDLSERVGVSHTTVNKVLARLRKEGYVISEPYRSLFLTEKGMKLAQKCKKRHEIVLEFLLKMGISRKNAEIDSEGIEHHISEETLKVFEKFIKKGQSILK